MIKIYIYMITTPTNAVYIGSSVNPKQRFKQHSNFFSAVGVHLIKHGYSIKHCRLTIIKEGIYKSRTKAEFDEAKTIEEYYTKYPILNKQTITRRFCNYFNHNKNIDFTKSLIANPENFIFKDGKYINKP